jgi:MFS transporter, PPP family, 3-phenylpropionic acid transporter
MTTPKHDTSRDADWRTRSNPPSSLPYFFVLYAVLYASFGTTSPYLPALFGERGLTPEQIGLVFATGTAIRLISAPVAGRIADRTQALRLTLAICAIAAALAAVCYETAVGLGAILAIFLSYSFALAPTTNIADALSLAASRREHFEYGWVRGAGSAAFILGSLLVGWAISNFGFGIIIWLQALLLLIVPFAVRFVPSIKAEKERADAGNFFGVATLVRLPVFRRIVLVAAIVLGSHAMHDTFAVIRWRAAGISPGAISILWSLSVAAEVVVFCLIGPWLLRKLAPAGAIALAATAGAVRWFVAALTADVAALSVIQPLHGLSFALLHLACMRLLADVVPLPLAATAQALYGTVAVGISTALLTLVSGWLYARMAASAFGIMGVLCLMALPVAATLRKFGIEPARGSD